MGKQTSKEQVARELWLKYFNQALYQANVISEREYRAMTQAIRRRLST